MAALSVPFDSFLTAEQTENFLKHKCATEFAYDYKIMVAVLSMNSDQITDLIKEHGDDIEAMRVRLGDFLVFLLNMADWADKSLVRIEALQ